MFYQSYQVYGNNCQQIVRDDDDDTIMLIQQETIVRNLLREWPYDQLSSYMNQIFDTCGMIITITVCSTILKEISATTQTTTITKDPKEESTSFPPSLPLQSIVQACWKTIQRMLLSQNHANANDDDDTNTNEGFQDNKMILLQQTTDVTTKKKKMKNAGNNLLPKLYYCCHKQ